MKEIKSTKNYKQFEKLIGNRKVDERRVQKIMKSIREVGYITSPIIVNENFEVIDGQGRLEALERLHMPVEYIVEQDIGIKECISMNVNQTNWTIMDYIVSFASRGDDSYIKLLNLKQKYNEFTINTLATALYGITRFSINIIAKGNLVITEENIKDASERLDYVRQFIPYLQNKTIGTDRMLQALLLCTYLSIDKNKLFNKITQNINLIKPYRTILECMISIEELYNYQSHNPVYLATEYRKFSRENLKRGLELYNKGVSNE